MQKKVQTQFGQIEVKKGHSLSPTNKFRQSAYLQESALLLGQDHVFESSSDFLKRFCNVDLSGKQIENLCHHYGAIIEAEEVQNTIENSTYSDFCSDDLHYAMVDGSFILSREKGWTETKVGRIFKAEDNFAISEKRRSIHSSDYIAHIGSHTEFTNKLAPYLDRLTHLVFVADGATWIWKWVSDCYPKAVQILDFYHVFEKISQWAALVFKDKEKRIDWRENAKKLLLSSKTSNLINQIKKIETQGEKADKQKGLLTYLQNNLQRMDYKTYLENDYLIGSGAIEAAQRTVVQQRLKRSGQRWTLDGGQQVLNLRTKKLSGKWNQVNQMVRNAA